VSPSSAGRRGSIRLDLNGSRSYTTGVPQEPFFLAFGACGCQTDDED
jgi:hypothetical protein